LLFAKLRGVFAVDLFAFRKPLDSRAPWTKKVIDERILFSNCRPSLGLIFCQMSCARKPIPRTLSLLPPTTEMPRGKSGSAEIPPDSPLTLLLDQKSQPGIKIPITTSRSPDTTRVSLESLPLIDANGRSFGVSDPLFRSLLVPVLWM
jgi:hypothetical protein